MNSDYFGKLVLIEDTLSINAKQIATFPLPTQIESLEVVCLEKLPEKWMEIFGDRYKLNFHTDYEQITQTTFNGVVFVDSINLLSALNDWNVTLRFLETLIKSPNVKRVILILHTDCLTDGDKMSAYLRYLSSTVITLKEKKTDSDYVAEIRNVFSSGKVKRSDYDVTYDRQNSTWRCRETKKELKTVTKNVTDVYKMTSFKIAVEKEAEKVKRDLILPYTETINDVNKVIQDYEIDDWDDEDPDDDLNI